MRKILSILLILSAVLLILSSCGRSSDNVQSFDLSEYEKYLEQFKNVDARLVFDEIKTTYDAKKAIDKIAKEKFDESLFESVFSEYEYRFDQNAGVWLVRKHFILFYFSGAYVVIISKDGKVLAFWGEK